MDVDDEGIVSQWKPFDEDSLSEKSELRAKTSEGSEVARPSEVRYKE